METFYITFPLKYNQQPHPLFPDLIDGNSIVEVEATNEEQAREFVTDHFDIYWAFIYSGDMLERLKESNSYSTIVGTITSENTLKFG